MARYDLDGKVALVTGAARGIGFATARALAARGASVTLVDLDAGAVEQAAGEIHDSRTLGLAADVTDRGAMQRAVARTVERFGGLDVVVANAGIASRAVTFRAGSHESFERVIAVNQHGVVNTVEAALGQIVARRGHVVVIASVYAFMTGVGAIPYAMSKAAVEQFGRALRVELVQHGASASVAYFGFIDTEMVHQALDHDPVAVEGLAALPGPLKKRLAPSVAGEAIVRGIERRAPRIIRPRRWTAISISRGWLSPIVDLRAERDPEVQKMLRRIDAREGEGELDDQPS